MRQLAEDPLQAALSALHPPMPEGKEHLVYRDFPKLPVAVWEWMKSVFEDYELHLLTEARYEGPNGVFMRGQVFIHPNGLTALKERFDLEGAALFNEQQ